MARIKNVSPNILAFLDLIAVSECGQALLNASDDGYLVLVGATTAHPLLFADYAAHPHVYNAQFNSTAAGRYQFLFRTWEDLRTRLGLPDFGPVSQDRGCIELLREHGAIQHILNGSIIHAVEIAAAIGDSAPVWASLPGAGYGQHENHAQYLMGIYGQKLALYESAGEALGL